MLSPISRVPCWSGLQAGFELQLTLARWLCDASTTRASVKKANVQALHAHADVQDWLWKFLLPRSDHRRLLKAAKLVATHNLQEKQRLSAWLNTVAGVAAQFQSNPQQWPAPPEDLPHWGSFRELMEAFYERLGTGLPFDANGHPTTNDGITYKKFFDEFKATHSDRVCVVCGDRLKGAQIDHWIDKARYPVLSIAPDNLLPMCSDCNEAPGKGAKPVYALGASKAFQDWFHPHHCSAHGRIELRYEPKTVRVVAIPINTADAAKTSNLDNLVQLSTRWTGEFKAEHRSKLQEMRQLVAAGRIPKTEGGIDDKLRESLDGLVDDRPNYHVHRVLYESVLEPERLKAWVAEL